MWEENRNELICIDPGHGGYDPGAVGQDGLFEKDVALKISNLVAYKLASCGITILMTREDDRYIKLEERAYIANRAGADLFVCIHLNSVASSTAHGSEVLLYSKDHPLRFMAQDILLNLQELGLRNRGIKPRPDLTVLKRTKMPAVLVETAFISCKNDPDFSLLRSPAGLNLIAEAIAVGILGG